MTQQPHPGTPDDQMREGASGALEDTYVEGEMTREQLHVEPIMTEIEPGATLEEHVPTRAESIPTIHGEDVAMHDEEVRRQNPPIVVNP